ncbi:MAG: hypothetical protein JRI34_00890 [Deltaproteobacteria bacterium]|nr:hypothetical protein [Deltaproteobacteria bacterium]
MTEIIVEILKDLGIYDRARAKFDSDDDLATCFHENFDDLIVRFAR